MLHSIAVSFGTLGHDVLRIGGAIVDLIQHIIDGSAPGGGGGGKGGQYPFA